MKKCIFAAHWWDRGGSARPRWDRGREVAMVPLCKAVKTSGPIVFSMKPTCRRCRFYLLAPKLGREGALAQMAIEDAAHRKAVR